MKLYNCPNLHLILADIDGTGKSTSRANIGHIEPPNGDTISWAPMQRIFAQPDLFGVWELE